MKMKNILLGLMTLLFVMLISAGANDPARFGNLTDTTVMIGGAEGIIWINMTNLIYANASLGRVGIGTINPSRKLHVNASVDNGVALFESTDDYSLIWFKDNPTTTIAIGSYQDQFIVSNSNLDNIRMVINYTSGNVGIGKLTPTAKLDVAGLVNASEFSGAHNWSDNQNYPSACPANTYVSQINDSITCTAITTIDNAVTVNGTIVGVWENGLSDDSLILNMPANGDALDYSGQGNDGVLYNDTNYTTGRFGKAFNFDGVGDYVNTTSSITQYPFTISAWVNSHSDKFQVIVDLTTKISTDISYALYLDWNGIASARSRNTWSYSAQASEDIADGNWHFLTGVWYNNTARSIFVDGIYKNISTDNSTFNIYANKTAIGRFDDSTPDRFFNGSIDDVMIFNRSLSANEVLALYSQSAEFYGRNSFRSTMGSVGIGTSSPSGKLSIQNDGTGNGVFIDQNGDGTALNIDNTGTRTSIKLEATQNTVRAANTPVMFISDARPTTDANAASSSLYIQGANNILQTSPLLSLYNYASTNQDSIRLDHYGNGTVINLINAGTGNGVFIDQNGNGIGLNIDSEATTAPALKVAGNGYTQIQLDGTGDCTQNGFMMNGTGIYACWGGVGTKLN